MINSGMFSSNTDEWSTPEDFFEKCALEYGPFDLDPCATKDNAKAPAFYTKADDGLSQTWSGRIWMNPPYGRGIGKWMAKAYESSQTTADIVVCLVPARTDTAWWHDYAMLGDVTFIRGRLKFGGSKNAAPFPSALVVFHKLRKDNDHNKYYDAYHELKDAAISLVQRLELDKDVKKNNWWLNERAKIMEVVSKESEASHG